jgi:hypothetical protein
MRPTDTICRTDVRVQSAKVSLEGNLALPEVTHGIVVFAHGSGSSRHGPRLPMRAVEAMLFSCPHVDPRNSAGPEPERSPHAYSETFRPLCARGCLQKTNLVGQEKPCISPFCWVPF